MKGGCALASATALMWAGLVIGGSLIAAPAKFNAPSLSLTTALEVGRAQFFAVGIGEIILCTLLIATMVLTRTWIWRLMAAPVVVFAIQRLALMPALDARTVRIIAGESVGPSHVHIVFIVLEILKVALLVAIAVWGLWTITRENAQ